MAYRKAKGLCYKCGLKWHPGHKCASTVSTHMIEELWQLVHGDQSVSGTSLSQGASEDSDSGEDFVALSANAVQGTEAPRIIRLMSKFHATEVVILMDSGILRVLSMKL